MSRCSSRVILECGRRLQAKKGKAFADVFFPNGQGLLVPFQVKPRASFPQFTGKLHLWKIQCIEVSAKQICIPATLPS